MLQDYFRTLWQAVRRWPVYSAFLAFALLLSGRASWHGATLFDDNNTTELPGEAPQAGGHGSYQTGYSNGYQSSYRSHRYYHK